MSGHVFSPNVTSLTLEFADGDSLRLRSSSSRARSTRGSTPSGSLPAISNRDTGLPGSSHATHTARSSALRSSAPQPTLIPIRPRRPFGLGPVGAPAGVLGHPDRADPDRDRRRDHRVAGANGAVRITAHAASRVRSRASCGRVTISCFRVTREFGIPGVRGYGPSGALADSIGLTLTGVGRPLDGCEIDSPRGHRWPDPLGSHSPIELAFTTKGRAYFADRAAARDLALFVRSGRMQRIRREPHPELLRDMNAAYGPELATAGSATRSPPRNHVHRDERHRQGLQGRRH